MKGTYKMSNRKTTKEYKNEIETKTNNEYTIVSEYKTSNDKVTFKHMKCGREYICTPKNFNKGRRCSSCNNVNKVKTTDQFAKEVIEMSNGEYNLISDYGKNNKEKVTLLHNICNKEFLISPNNFINGHGCPYCFKRNILKTTKQFKEEVKHLGNNEYILLTEYKNNETKVKMLHINCNNKYYVTPTKFINGRRCPKCSTKSAIIKRTKTSNTFENEVLKLTNAEYLVIGNYVNNKVKIEMKHKKCKKIYSVRPNDFLQGYRCPYCNESKGETKIRLFLDKNNIEYKKEYTYPDLFDKEAKSLLRFDFYIESYNQLIEFDGIQHFEKGWYDTDEDLEDRKYKDQLKDNYCRNNNIKLLRISYDELDIIENILKKELKFND